MAAFCFYAILTHPLTPLRTMQGLIEIDLGDGEICLCHPDDEARMMLEEALAVDIDGDAREIDPA